VSRDPLGRTHGVGVGDGFGAGAAVITPLASAEGLVRSWPLPLPVQLTV
jgi:hypothetical protein